MIPPLIVGIEANCFPDKCGAALPASGVCHVEPGGGDHRGTVGIKRDSSIGCGVKSVDIAAPHMSSGQDPLYEAVIRVESDAPLCSFKSTGN